MMLSPMKNPYSKDANTSAIPAPMIQAQTAMIPGQGMPVANTAMPPTTHYDMGSELSFDNY